MPKDMGVSKEMSMNGRGGHLYMQTNEVKNAIIHYHRSATGTLTEVERVATGGAGSGTFKPISGQESAPNSFEGAASVILSPDRKFLFATNGGDNSVSSFAVGAQGRLALIDTKPTGNAVEGKSGTAKSLAYSPSKDMLYVVHSFGPDHIRLMSVSSDGRLTQRMERYTANTPEKPHRVPTMGVLSPDEKFLLVGTTFVYQLTDRSTRVLAAELTADHVKCFGVMNTLLGTSADRVTIENAMLSTFGWQMHVPEALGGSGLELVGARPCLYAKGKMAHLMYRHNGHPVSVFMIPNMTRPENPGTPGIPGIKDEVVDVMGHEATVWSAGVAP